MAEVVHCRAYKADGVMCSLRANTEGGIRCRTHQNQYDRNVERYGAFLENQCEIVKIGRKCPHAKIEGELVCQHHHDTFQRMRANAEQQRLARQTEQEAQRERNHRITEVVLNFRLRVPRPTWQSVATEMHEAVDNEQYTREDGMLISERYAATRIVLWPPTLIRDYWIWMDTGRVGEEPQPQELPQFAPVLPPVLPPRHVVPRLQALARDTQNVHTNEVVHQTNESTQKLLEEYERSCKTKRMRSPDWFAAKWLTERYGGWANVVRVVDDMQRWYATKTCRTENDRLYAKCLDGLYKLIRNIENEDIKKELYKRAFEECWEAMEMCCEGHISRLCNVMVGFDDAFKPAVPLGELLQNAIATIASSEKEPAEKIAEAKKVFDELKVPDSDRDVWLDALAAY